MKSECVVLFSGGTDSLCAAALCCESYSKVHLLTFFEKATCTSPVPLENIKKLQQHYPATEIVHLVISTDKLVRLFSYENYFNNLRKFHFFNLATPGLSSLSWHVSAIQYCRQNKIFAVFDGMTRELLHLPGHMSEIRDLFTELYKNYGIRFGSPVIDWDIPEDQRFIDKLIVDRHGFTLQPKLELRTTGLWLYEKNFLPHPNVKGSHFDRLMQHDCYPFVVYNMLVFWICVPVMGYERFKAKLSVFFRSKIHFAENWLNENL